MNDREKVINAWEIFRNSNPYQICDGKEFRAIKEPEYCMGQMIEDTIALLQEAENVVRCKDCIEWDETTEECSNIDSVCFRNGRCRPDWFCADGERKEGR